MVKQFRKASSKTFAKIGKLRKPIAINTPQTPSTHEVRKMPRYSVKIADPVEELLHEARGHLMTLKRKDIDKTKAFNIFLTMGLFQFLAKIETGTLSEKDLKIVDLFTKADMDYDSAMDELGTMILKLMEKGGRK